MGASIGGIGLKTTDVLATGGDVGGRGSARVTGNGGGVTAGGTVGYNLQMGSYVAGVEGDYAYASVGNNATSTSVPNFGPIVIGASSSMTQFGTARARIGYAMDRALFYATGGAAFAKIQSSGINSFLADPAAFAIVNKFKVGWTAGAGVEYSITNNLSFKVEGLYADLGNQTAVDAGGGVQVFHNVALVGRAGVNYKFDMGGAVPVVARY